MTDQNGNKNSKNMRFCSVPEYCYVYVIKKKTCLIESSVFWPLKSSINRGYTNNLLTVCVTFSITLSMLCTFLMWIHVGIKWPDWLFHKKVRGKRKKSLQWLRMCHLLYQTGGDFRFILRPSVSQSVRPQNWIPR
jgi:hypothetical protein